MACGSREWTRTVVRVFLTYLENEWTSIPCVCMHVSSTRSVGNNTPKWPFPNVNDFADFSQRQWSRRSTVFLYSAMPRCCFALLTHTHALSLSRPLSHTHTLSHSLALPLALPLPLLYSLRFGKKAFSCITRGPDYQSFGLSLRLVICVPLAVSRNPDWCTASNASDDYCLFGVHDPYHERMTKTRQRSDYGIPSARRCFKEVLMRNLRSIIENKTHQ